MSAASSSQSICDRVGFAYGPRTILHDISLTVAGGDRIGIVGPNGTGKTTLLRVLVGELVAASGSVTTIPSDATVGLLTQQLGDRPGESIAEYVKRRSGMQPVLDEFEASLAAVADAAPGSDERYDVALTRYLATDAATIDQRTEAMLDTVGLSTIEATRPTASLSGGQRTRVNLAATLLSAYDVLLLDEPTNDLDLSGLSLLEDMVMEQQGPVVLVSHDRAFLERVTTAIFELDDHTHSGTRFNGGYAAWEEARQVARRHEYEAFDEYNRKRDNLKQRSVAQQQWANKGSSRAKNDKSEGDKFIRAHRIATSEKMAGKAKQTARALERFERNEKVDAPWEPWELRLEFAPADRSSTEVAVLHQAVVQRGDFRLGPIDAALVAGDRVLITGENGSGKSTLLDALLGRIELTAGSRHLGPSVELATLQQSREVFGGAPSLLRGFTDQTGMDTGDARSQLAKLGLDSDRIQRRPEDLSPGERTRAALGLFAATGSNLLVLDEPTNHLDLPAIEQLEAALSVFPHTVVLVTHDRRLIAAVETTRHWHVANGQLTEA